MNSDGLNGCLDGVLRGSFHRLGTGSSRVQPGVMCCQEQIAPGGGAGSQVGLVSGSMTTTADDAE